MEPTGENREIAVIFIDLSESDSFKTSNGTEEEIKRVFHFNLITTQTIREIGHLSIQKEGLSNYGTKNYLNNVVMGYFEGKSCCDVALTVAESIQNLFKATNNKAKTEFKFKPKIGIDFGQVFFAKYFRDTLTDPVGFVVDRASRLATLAEPTQILITEEVKKRALKEKVDRMGPMEEKCLRGIREPCAIREILWDEAAGLKGIRIEEPPTVFMVHSDQSKVFKFIEENKLIEDSNQIDLYLYSYETLATEFRNKLCELKIPLTIKVLIRNPKSDDRKALLIKSSINIMAGIMNTNPHVTYCVRFYNDQPFARLYLFRKTDGSSEGLVGFYKRDLKNLKRFIGAGPDQLMIHVKGRSYFEEHLLSTFDSRFEGTWKELTSEKAVLFDLDGVLIDSMPYHYIAWKEAFKKVDINITKEDIYEKEGVKKEDIVRDVYHLYKRKKPTQDEMNSVIWAKTEEYRKVSRLVFFDGAIELLDMLKEKGIKLALVTGSTNLFSKFETKKGFLEKFDVIVSGENVKKGKPHPDPYLFALERLKNMGIKVENCLVVENAINGIKSAVGANLTCYVVRGGTIPPESILKGIGAKRIFQNIKELRKVLVWMDTNFIMEKFMENFGDSICLSDLNAQNYPK
jgi:beta-phosphoglucomutase